ncbi:FixH family protein [Bacillus sp. SB49]|uniref:FixH family protein n=1 Tax=Bacillaceae TaxID=186817 RepID=UPI0004062077|nr:MULTISPECIES: FixH family protein [Bacillaceae]QHT45438.1 FixH family protein [Bacillus sp. SB49]
MGRKSIIGTFLMVGILLMLTACGGEDNAEQQAADSDLVPLDVRFSTTPEEQLEPGDTFTLQAHVTKGEEAVNDADEVQFEMWQDGQDEEDHKMLEGESTGDGMYEVETSVEEAGLYYVVSHVQARGSHNMPKDELVIGDVDSAQKEPSEEEGGMVHIMMEEPVEKGEETTLTAHVMEAEAPVEGADVRFEVWKEGEESHDFVDAEEAGETYTADYVFPESGTYQVKLHVEKGDWHTHKEKAITVN